MIPMRIDHIAVAVKSVEDTADRLCRVTGYARRTAVVTNTRQRVNVLFLARPGSLDIKLIEPADPDSPLWGSLRRGEGLHHVAFKVDDVQTATEELRAQGVRILAPPEPGEAFDEALIAFCYLGAGVNAELIDTDARRAELDEGDR